jgi:hypothetical protein
MNSAGFPTKATHETHEQHPGIPGRADRPGPMGRALWSPVVGNAGNPVARRVNRDGAVLDQRDATDVAGSAMSPEEMRDLLCTVAMWGAAIIMLSPLVYKMAEAVVYIVDFYL